MRSKPTLTNFILGNSDSKYYIKSIYFSTILMIFISILSQLLFPNQFFFWNHTISSQGSILKNPVGNYFWRLGIVIIALLKFPDVMFISNKLKSVSKGFSQISKTCGLIATTGFFFVGFFPEEIKPLHGISAFICFVGYFVMINLNLVIISLDLKKKNSPNYTYLIKNRGKIRILYILVNIGFYFMIASSIFKNLKISFPLWEWFYFFCLILWFLMFPTFIERDKEYVVFEINSVNFAQKIKSRVVQASLLIFANYVFSMNQQKKSSKFFVI